MARQIVPDADKTAADLAALRAATREAHEAIKDARIVIRELHDATADTVALLAIGVDGLITAAVRAGLDRYAEVLSEQTQRGVEAINARYDAVAEEAIGMIKRDAEHLAQLLDETEALQKRVEAGVDMLTARAAVAPPGPFGV